ncbi:MAG: hypothetical protein OXN97_20830 [Bryobacterales bacterium]|nr:hypothetical protein [Bryobacterales bacterium]
MTPCKALLDTLTGPLHDFPGRAGGRARASSVRFEQWRLAFCTHRNRGWQPMVEIAVLVRHAG